METASAASGLDPNATSATVVTVTITRGHVTSSAKSPESATATTITVTSSIVQETSSASEDPAENSEVHTAIQTVVGTQSASVVTVTAPSPTASQTVNDGIVLTNTTTLVPPSVTPQLAAASSQTLTLTPDAVLTNDTEIARGALISTREFFTYDIESDCERDCEDWSDLEKVRD